MANQGVNNADCKMAKKWQEVPENKLKALCDGQLAEDIEVSQYQATMKRMN